MPVVDASIVIDWVAPGTDPSSSALRVLHRLPREDAEIMTPRLLLEEVANALLTGVRRRRWTGVAADESHALLLRLPLRLVDDERDLVRAWNLARRYDNHPLYDMLYVAVAERLNTTFITADQALRNRLGQLSWVLAPEQASI